jgi:putative restriction endonuclease
LDLDIAVRLAAFNWLSEQVQYHGDVLPRKILETGFIFENERIPLLSPQGIFKPKKLDLVLSITTTPEGPYKDSFSKDGFLLYKYRGTDPSYWDNKALRNTYRQNRPLIFFHGIIPGKYLAVWPVYIIEDNPTNLFFKVTVDDMQSVNLSMNSATFVSESDNARREYITRSVRQRLHQQGFREKVLTAYRDCCSLCRLKHRELLDAAHIIPDTEPEGEPLIYNGIALCKLHHAAFDKFILGITPDYIIHIRRDVLDEEDGPMLLHGLKGFHNSHIILPASKVHWPKQEYLEKRYQRFREAV